jgi:hypothetical protein
MARVIPNEKSYICFATTVANIAAPTALEITNGVNLTPFVVSLTASTQGNQLPTPAFDSLFETSISGTVQASFTMDCYRDDSADTAWTTLPRGTDGFVIISRFGGTGTDNKPIATNKVEVWPVRITSRSMQAMSSNQVQMFQVTCAVTTEPNENATVAA